MEDLKYLTKDKKINNKDLVTLGLYTLLFIFLMAIGVGVCAGVFTFLLGGKAYFVSFATVSISFFTAFAFTLIFNKINKNNIILIFGTTMSIFLVSTGRTLLAIPIFLLGTVLSEYFYRKNKEYLSYIFYCLGNIGAIIPLYFMKNNYIEHLTSKGYSQEKIEFITRNTTLEMFIVIVFLTILSACIGLYFSRKLYYKNFDKAGF